MKLPGVYGELEAAGYFWGKTRRVEKLVRAEAGTS